MEEPSEDLQRRLYRVWGRIELALQAVLFDEDEDVVKFLGDRAETTSLVMDAAHRERRRRSRKRG